MTNKEVRDRLAEIAGWERPNYARRYWRHTDGRVLVEHEHPIPANSIDALLPLWPEGLPRKRFTRLSAPAAWMNTHQELLAPG